MPPVGIKVLTLVDSGGGSVMLEPLERSHACMRTTCGLHAEKTAGRDLNTRPSFCYRLCHHAVCAVISVTEYHQPKKKKALNPTFRITLEGWWQFANSNPYNFIFLSTDFSFLFNSLTPKQSFCFRLVFISLPPSLPSPLLCSFHPLCWGCFLSLSLCHHSSGMLCGWVPFCTVLPVF